MIEIAIYISISILILAFVMSMIRLVRGPTLQDRVVALDLVGAVAAGIIIIFMLMNDRMKYLDVVLVLSLILFLGTTTIARFLNKEKK
jgi:multicomponent Na+:H+ antiporter subunit F